MRVQVSNTQVELTPAIASCVRLWFGQHTPWLVPTLTWQLNAWRLTKRHGKKRAAVAVAHSILVIAYHLIGWQEAYRDLGADYFDKQRPESTTKRLVKCLEKLGYQVSLQPQMSAPAV